jgi:hypothetical protein
VWFVVVPTITGGALSVHSAAMAPSADAVPGDGRPLPSWQAVETLGVSEIVVAILEARKTKPWATAARVSREQRDDLVYVRVTFLEEPSAAGGLADKSGRGEVIAAFAADRLREDLALAFGQKDVIILK